MHEPSIIPRGVVVEGAIEGEGDLIVLGEVHGPIRMGGGVSVERGALVRGHVRAQSVVIAGVLKGNIYADGSVRLDATARVVGDLRAPRIRLTKGAQLRGRLHMEALDAPTMETLDLADWDAALHTFTGMPAPEPFTSSQLFEARSRHDEGATIPTEKTQAALDVAESIKFPTNAPDAALASIILGQVGVPSASFLDVETISERSQAAFMATALPDATPVEAEPTSAASKVTISPSHPLEGATIPAPGPTGAAAFSVDGLEQNPESAATLVSKRVASSPIPSLKSHHSRRDTLLAPPPLPEPTDVAQFTPYHGDNAPTIPPPAEWPRTASEAERTIDDTMDQEVTVTDQSAPTGLFLPIPALPVLPAKLPVFGRLVAIHREKDSS